jgi:hypothetical protein
MALMKVKWLNCEPMTGYAPSWRDALLNTDEIVSAVPTEVPGDGSWLHVRLRCGKVMTIVGDVDGFLDAVMLAEAWARARQRRGGEHGREV